MMSNNIYIWVVWALLLIAQNFSFTYTSRARNSGSLKKHMIAAIFSNGIWFAGQLMVVSEFMKILSGKYGIGLAIGAGIFYTIFTLIGSLTAHYHALKTEKGKGAVGANKKYAQITVESYELIKQKLNII